MVIKTEICEFTEYRVYPGRGQRYVTKDGKVHFFISHKVASLFKQRIRPVKLHWTQAWRKMNKKGKTEAYTRKRTRRTTKVQKAVVGLTLEDLNTKRAAPKPKTSDAVTKEHKEKAKKTKVPVVKSQASTKNPALKPMMQKGRM